MRSSIGLSDFLGLSRLALDGARTITGVVEEVHATIAAPFDPFTTPGTGRMGGIAGLVYRGIRAGYDVAGAGVQAALKRTPPVAAETLVPGETPGRDKLLAVLNGVWGDHLEADGNPLAIPMSLRVGGGALATEGCAQASGNRVLLMVHGLCMTDLDWQHAGHDHGAELACEVGYTPLYLRYNSGLHVSTNGRRLADLLERTVMAWPEPVAELVVVGYSMGGLVARSAVYYGQEAGHAWPGKLSKLVFVGTPHHGSRLERVGHRADELFNLTSFSAPLRRLGTTRSAGITDLRHGSVTDEDWEGADRFGHHHDTRCPAPLPEGVNCYAIGAVLGSRSDDMTSRVLGDGLVPLPSALGIHGDPQHSLAFPESNRWVACGTDHAALLKRPEVYAKLREWLAD